MSNRPSAACDQGLGIFVAITTRRPFAARASSSSTKRTPQTAAIAVPRPNVREGREIRPRAGRSGAQSGSRRHLRCAGRRLIRRRGGEDAGELLGDAALDLLGEGREEKTEIHGDVDACRLDGHQRVEPLARDGERAVVLPAAGGAVVARQLLGGAGEALLRLVDGELVRDVDLVLGHGRILITPRRWRYWDRTPGGRPRPGSWPGGAASPGRAAAPRAGTGDRCASRRAPAARRATSFPARRRRPGSSPRAAA